MSLFIIENELQRLAVRRCRIRSAEKMTKECLARLLDLSHVHKRDLKDNTFRYTKPGNDL
jgi:hypothetical protein